MSKTIVRDRAASGLKKSEKKLLDDLVQMPKEEFKEKIKGTNIKIRNIVRAYSDKVKDRAWRAYLEAGTIEGASKLMQIPQKTLREWCEENEWEKKREKKEELIVTDDQDFEAELTIKELCTTYGIKPDMAETLKEVKIISGMCFAAIKGDPTLEEKVKLYPQSFESVMKALKVCWDTRLKIFDTKDNKVDHEKPDLFKAAIHVHGDLNVNKPSNDPGQALLGQLKYME
jgi:hypothetical protein